MAHLYCTIKMPQIIPSVQYGCTVYIFNNYINDEFTLKALN